MFSRILANTEVKFESEYPMRMPIGKFKFQFLEVIPNLSSDREFRIRVSAAHFENKIESLLQISYSDSRFDYEDIKFQFGISGANFNWNSALSFGSILAASVLLANSKFIFESEFRFEY